MNWIDKSPRDFGTRASEDTRHELLGTRLRLTVWCSGPLSAVWFLNCAELGIHGRSLAALNSRAAKIEAIEVVAREVEKSAADLPLMKRARL